MGNLNIFYFWEKKVKHNGIIFLSFIFYLYRNFDNYSRAINRFLYWLWFYLPSYIRVLDVYYDCVYAYIWNNIFYYLVNGLNLE